MGIAKGAAGLIFEFLEKEIFKGDLLQIGKQKILFSSDELNSLTKQFKLNREINNNFSKNSTEFFKSLGVKNCSTLDSSDYEGAEIIHDLNQEISKDYAEKFDYIYDGGSLEHIFNVPQALKNFHNLLKPNGIIMHFLPCNNYVDHGFYSFNPTLFKDYYERNNYKILKIYIVKQGIDKNKDEWIIYNYDRELVTNHIRWNWGKNKIMVWVVVKKKESSTTYLAPTQFRYQNRKKNNNEGKRNDKNNLKRSLVEVIKLFYYHCIFKYINQRKKPKVVFKC